MNEKTKMKKTEESNKVSGEELTMELLQALKDYFVGKAELKEGGIALSLFGGQTFFISVKESA